MSRAITCSSYSPPTIFLRMASTFLHSHGIFHKYVPSSLPCVTTLSISSSVKFNLLPYSAAQHPVQWRLQALLESIIFTLYFFSHFYQKGGWLFYFLNVLWVRKENITTLSVGEVTIGIRFNPKIAAARLWRHN